MDDSQLPVHRLPKWAKLGYPVHPLVDRISTALVVVCCAQFALAVGFVIVAGL